MTVKKIVHQHNNPIVDQTEVANLIYPAPAQPFLKTEQFCHNHATFPTIFGCYNGYCALKFKPFQGVKNSLESGERPCIMLFIRVRHQSCSLPTRSNWVTTKRERCLSDPGRHPFQLRQVSSLGSVTTSRWHFIWKLVYLYFCRTNTCTVLCCFQVRLCN